MLGFQYTRDKFARITNLIHEPVNQVYNSLAGTMTHAGTANSINIIVVKDTSLGKWLKSEQTAPDSSVMVWKVKKKNGGKAHNSIEERFVLNFLHLLGNLNRKHILRKKLEI